MDKLSKLIRDLRMEFRERCMDCQMIVITREDFDRVVSDVTEGWNKPVKRIPAKRDKPRTSKDLHPRPDAGEAVTIYPDGREVCNDNAAGRREYGTRTMDMWERQDRYCAACGRILYPSEATFDHEDGRTSGHKDERLWRDDGKPMNAALHEWCNIDRGSKRTPYAFQTTLTREQYEARKES